MTKKIHLVDTLKTGDIIGSRQSGFVYTVVRTYKQKHGNDFVYGYITVETQDGQQFDFTEEEANKHGWIKL